MLRFRKIPLAKKLTDKRKEGGKGGLSRLSVEIFLSDSAEIFRWKTFSVSLILGIEKVWIKGGGRSEYQDSPSKFFCLRVPKTFVEEPL